jgi:(p)ppGpp synthase/HD superfamily hydrolase
MENEGHGAVAPPSDDGLVTAAKAFAEARHEGQMRRDGRTPYIVHPLRVAKLLRETGVPDPDLQCAALLHDVVEDTLRPGEDDTGLLWEIEGRFGSRVAQLVEELTKAPAGIESRRDYDWSFARKSADACVVKLADRLDNLRDWQGMQADFRRPYLAETMDLLAAIESNPSVPGSPFEPFIQALAGDLRALCAAEGVTRGRHPRPPAGQARPIRR